MANEEKVTDIQRERLEFNLSPIPDPIDGDLLDVIWLTCKANWLKAKLDEISAILARE